MHEHGRPVLAATNATHHRVFARSAHTAGSTHARLHARLIASAGAIAVFIFLLTAWYRLATLRIYFGEPSSVASYVGNNWQMLLWASLWCFATAVVSLIFAGVTTIALLVFGLLADGWLSVTEWLAASSQVVPFLVIVTIFLLFEMMVFQNLHVVPVPLVYSLGPVTLSLLFPPLVYGAKAIVNTQFAMKSLLRLWDPPIHWKIWQVYLPNALPDILTGLRTSATWAVGATLISEGLINGIPGDTSTLGSFLVMPFTAPPGRTPTAIFLSTALGFLVYFIFCFVESKIQLRLLGEVKRTEQTYE